MKGFDVKRALPFLLLAAACLGVYVNAIHNNFIQDDVYNVTQNTFIRDPANLPALFTRDYFRLSQEGAYRPLPTAVLFADYALFGYRVEGYRAVSLGWHILATLLLFSLLTKLLLPRFGERARGAAFWAALLFAVHPVNSQMISVISYHEDLICMVFMLGAFLAYLRGRLKTGVALFLAALFCKEMAVTLPAVLLLYEWLLAPRAAGEGLCDRLKARGPALAAFWAAAALFVLGRFSFFKPVGIAMESNAAAIAHWPGAREAAVNAFMACLTVWRSVRLLVWPGELSADWDSVLAHQVTPGFIYVLAFLGLAAVAVAAWKLRRRAPWAAFGILYFLVTLLPVSGIVPFWSSLAERYLYIPSAGLFLLAGLGLEALWRRAVRPAYKLRGAGLALLALAAPAALAWRTVARNPDYKNELTLYAKETTDYPRSYGAWYGLGFALGQHGRYAEARAAFLKADALDQYHKTHFMLGFVEDKLHGPPARVEEEYRKAIALEPGYYPAHFNLASLLHREGRLKEAVGSYKEALRINPNYREARANLGAALMGLGDFSGAARELALALAARPELETSLTAGLEAKIEHNLAAALFNLDRNQEAAEHLSRAIALEPALAQTPIVKTVRAATPAPRKREVPPLLARLRGLYPGLAEKWDKAAPLQYETSPDGVRPSIGYKGSSQAAAALKPEERAALDALALRESAAEALSARFLPAGPGMEFRWQGLDVTQNLKYARAVPASAEGGLVRYPAAYPHTEVFYAADAGAVEQFFLLDSPQAPHSFLMSLQVSGGAARVTQAGELELAGNGRTLRLSRPAVFDAAGRRRDGDWQLSGPAPGRGYDLALSFNPAGLNYPLLVDPVWTNAGAGSLSTARDSHTATLLPNGKVLVVGGRYSTTMYATAELYDPATGIWSTTGSLSTGRVYHTATLLPNGKVLVAGGINSAYAKLPTAELYDPSVGTWSTTGPLSTAREYHTATLLSTGKVLVAGGTGGSNLLTAELYDPSVGTWSATGSLSTARYLHTATLLPNGKVLVAAGNGEGNIFLLTAEIYDPGAGTWSATGSLSTGRDFHTATLLPNGKVLAAGGESSTGVFILTAEIYNPSPGTWSATGSMVWGRGAHTATLLPNGKVIVSGGYAGGGLGMTSCDVYDPVAGTWSATGALSTGRYSHTATLLPNGKVLVAAGLNYSPTAELYDPSSGAWSATGSLSEERNDHTATLLPNGKVLVVGGNGWGSSLLTAELYDPSAGTWSATGSLSTAREFHSATLLPNGKVLVAGGGTGSGVLSTSELYDPSVGTWSATGSLSTARQASPATLLFNGKVLVAGGMGADGYSLLTAELYDPSAGTWSATGSLSTARRYHTATLLPDGKVLVAGGWKDGWGPLPTAEIYDPAAATWAITGTMYQAVHLHTATLLPDGEVLVAGGENGAATATRTAQLYTPAVGTWSATGFLFSGRDFHTATLLPSGKVMVTGGAGGGGEITWSTAELYDPAAGAWSVAGSLSTARREHTATLLPNGKILLAGGGAADFNIGKVLTAELARYTEYDYSVVASTMQPLISSVGGSSSFPVRILGGNSYSVGGARFKGYSEGSSGDSRSSPASYPRLYLRSLASAGLSPAGQDDQVVDISTSVYPISSWSGADTSITFTAPPSGLPNGYYMLYAMANAIPSDGVIVQYCRAAASYVTRMGGPGSWVWGTPDSCDPPAVQSGAPSSWQWLIWTPGSGRSVPQGGPSGWTWQPE